MLSPHTGRSIKLPAAEVLKSLPEIFGIRLNEEPSYDVIESDGNIKVRRYEPTVVASVTVSKSFEDFRNEAFKRLAAYIFGENEGGKEIAMTSPVLQRQVAGERIAMTSPALQAGSGIQWTMSFVLPKEFVTKSPPTPVDPSITLKNVAAQTLVACRYKGNNTERKMAVNRLKLEAWLKAHPSCKAVGEIYWAQYDAPFVIPFLKTNEALVEVSLDR